VAYDFETGEGWAPSLDAANMDAIISGQNRLWPTARTSRTAWTRGDGEVWMFGGDKNSHSLSVEEVRSISRAPAKTVAFGLLIDLPLWSASSLARPCVVVITGARGCAVAIYGA
jgi:hypothetical protein